MSGVNKVILVGRLGKDPEVRTLDNGKSVATFSLATSESYKDKSGERKENTQWHNIVVWQGLAEVAGKYLKKGSQLYVEGKLNNRSYEKDGGMRYVTEIIADQFTMLDTKGSKNSNATQAEPAPVSSDDIPY